MQIIVPLTFYSHIDETSPWHFGEVECRVYLDADRMGWTPEQIEVDAYRTRDGGLESEWLELPRTHALWPAIVAYMETEYRDQLADALAPTRKGPSWAAEHKLRVRELL